MSQSQVMDVSPLTEKTEPSRPSTPTPNATPRHVQTDSNLEESFGTLTEQDTSIDEDPDYITGIRLWLTMTCITIVSFLMLLDNTIVATATPRITDAFHSLKDVGWYGSAYQLANAALQPLTGKVYTSFSTKWSFLFFFTLFELGSLLCGVATSSTMLIIGRAVAGMGGSGIMNGATTIIAACVPMTKRPLLTGILFGVSQLGLVFGPLLGGALTEYSSWRWCFYINLPVGGAASIFILLIHIPDQMKKQPAMTMLRELHHHLDLLGFALFAPAPIMLLLALQYGGHEFAWNSSTVIGLFCGAGATFVVWCVYNRYKGEAALIPFSMAGKTVVWSSAATQMLLMGTLFLSGYFLPIYFQAVKGANPMLSGVYILPTILMQLVFTMISGGLLAKTGYVIPWTLIGAVTISVGSGVLSMLQPSTSTAEWIGLQLIAGFGRGLSMQMAFIAIQTILQPWEVALAMSLCMCAQLLGGSIFLTVANTIFSETLVSKLAVYAPNADADLVTGAGATGFRQVVDDADLPGVLRAYADGVDCVFYFAAALSAVAVFTLWGMGWVDLREKKRTKTIREGVVEDV